MGAEGEPLAVLSLSLIPVTEHGSYAAAANVNCSILLPFPRLFAIFLSLLPHFLQPDLLFFPPVNPLPDKACQGKKAEYWEATSISG